MSLRHHQDNDEGFDGAHNAEVDKQSGVAH